MEKHIFISYKHEDQDFAEVLINRVEKAGFKTWVDHDQLHIGDDWRNGIDGAIKNSFALIVIMTPEAKASEYVTYEWAFAWGAGVKVLPVIYKDTPLHPRLEALQHLNFTKLTARPWDKLVEAIKFASDTSDSSNKPVPSALPPQILDEVVALISSARAKMQGQTEESKLAANIEGTKETTERINKLITPSTPKQLNNASILWVDDRPTNNTYEQRALRALGIHISISTSTENALEQLSKEKFDVIISDMGRPPDQRAGYTLLQQLKERRINTPFIIYAGSKLTEHVDEAHRRGANGTTNNATELLEMVIDSIKNSQENP
jgi:CheY-like chemotaxis protein